MQRNTWARTRSVGGDMVEATIRMVDPNVSYNKVHASRGKVIRAEPVAALYEQGRIHHVGAFPTLEDQQCAFTTDFDRKAAGFSPDRVDALVWAMSDLLVEPMPSEGHFEYMRQRAARRAGTSLRHRPSGRPGPGRWSEPKAMTGVAIVIPMLNEAAGLPRVLRSLAALEPPPAIVIGVADPIPQRGRRNCSPRQRERPAVLPGFLPPACNPRDRREQGRSIRFKRQLVGPAKPMR